MLAAEGELPFPSLWKTKQALNPFLTEPALRRHSGLPFVRGARPHASGSYTRSPLHATAPVALQHGEEVSLCPPFLQSEPGKCGLAPAAASAGRDPPALSFACPAGLGAGRYPPRSRESFCPSPTSACSLSPVLRPRRRLLLIPRRRTSSRVVGEAEGRRAFSTVLLRGAGRGCPRCGGHRSTPGSRYRGSASSLRPLPPVASPPLAGASVCAWEGRGRGQRLLWAGKGRLSCSGSGSSASGVGLFVCLWVRRFIF